MSGRVHLAIHLVRRFVGALSPRPPSAADDVWAVGWLGDRETALWWQMQSQDRRHSLEVARRFVGLAPQAPRAAVAAALLHDVGKIDAHLGVVGRVVATIVGPRTERFRRYHDHERIGAELLRSNGSDALTVALIVGTCGDAALTAALQRADDI